MTDSHDPMYQKGFRRGRAKTEQEMEEVRAQWKRNEQWNQIYMSLLPIAMQVRGWSMDGTAVTNSDMRVELCRRWTNAAVRNLK